MSKMKKIYEAPALEIETYQLDASIASNCGTVVQMGPAGPGAVAVCDDYYEITGEEMPASANWSLRHNIDFWTELTCDCYYSASGTFFTS